MLVKLLNRKYSKNGTVQSWLEALCIVYITLGMRDD